MAETARLRGGDAMRPGQQAFPQEAYCPRCGRLIPAARRRRGISFCTSRCHHLQIMDDKESAEIEEGLQEENP
jgi:endogenous inhibitor of DNA gyrase (YacG/DUF329 family)